MSQPIRTIPSLAAVLDRWHVVVVLAALLYGGLHLLWYWQTPLGQAPVLDERENLDLAAQIATGTLTREPFYRAMGYPLLLASGHALGIPANLMPFYSTGLGLGLHILNSLLVAIIARRIFASQGAALIAGLAHALNPVLIHYATQILDGTFATTWMLLGGLCLFAGRSHKNAPTTLSTSIPEADTGRPRLAAIGVSLCWSMAALVRPQFLTLWMGFPLIWWMAAPIRTTVRQRLLVVALAFAAGAAPWLIQGLWQRTVCGQFRLMPTQGAYNLWAANRPGANGAYFTQQIHLTGSGSTHRNPTRVESEVLYERETGRAAANIDEVNTYWSRRLRDSIASDPFAWLRLIGRKVYLLLNDADQYNNKTYAFHKARSPMLRHNPLGWGVLMLATIAGIFFLWQRSRPAACAMLLITGLTAVGILLGFASGRFRAPLLSWLSVSAGAIALLHTVAANVIKETAISKHRPSGTRPAGSKMLVCLLTLRRGGALGAALLISGALTFSNFFGARSTQTFIEDHLLITWSATAIGDDKTAWVESGAALTLAPDHPGALAWRVTSYFNLLLTNRANPVDEPAWHETAERLLRLPATSVIPSVRTLAALACWRCGETMRAITVWKTLAETQESYDALAALILSGAACQDDLDRFVKETAGSSKQGLIHIASVAIGLEQTSNSRIADAAQRLFAHRPLQNADLIRSPRRY